MRTHLLLTSAALAVLLFSDRPAVQAGPLPARPARGPQGAPLAGLRTDRLSAKQLERWRAIVRIVFAVDNRGQALHPTLRRLWERVATSGHEVRIELAQGVSPAGGFRVEAVDDEGERHVAVIRLNLERIDRAVVRPGLARADGFVPFAGLSREQRRAEVLGHELAHAAWALASPARARMGLELRSGQDKLSRTIREHYRPGQPFPPEVRSLMARLDDLRAELEQPAEALEVLVWQELAGRRAPGEAGYRMADAAIDSLRRSITATRSSGATAGSTYSSRSRSAMTSNPPAAR